jgi:hypothetical protein
VDKQLGTFNVSLERLTDTAHCLRLKDQQRLESILDEFERRLPQCFCSVYFGVLPQGINVAEAGFWLLNHGERSSGGVVRRGIFGIVIVIDPAAHCIGVSLGYALELLIPQRLVEALLQKVSQHLWHGEYAEAVAVVLRDIDSRIRAHGTGQRREILRESGSTGKVSLAGVAPRTPEPKVLDAAASPTKGRL